jgi:hypothetical protein
MRELRQRDDDAELNAKQREEPNHLPFGAMDTFLAVASRRETRDYADRPIPDAITRRILDGGRLAGSAKNRQP